MIDVNSQSVGNVVCNRNHQHAPNDVSLGIVTRKQSCDDSQVCDDSRAAAKQELVFARLEFFFVDLFHWMNF